MKKTEKILLIIGTILILLIVVLSVNLYQNITGKAVEDDKTANYNYTYTKAICDENNLCTDYEIVCENGTKEPIRITALASAQFSPDWQDPRTPEQINKWCE